MIAELGISFEVNGDLFDMDEYEIMYSTEEFGIRYYITWKELKEFLIMHGRNNIIGDGV